MKGLSDEIQVVAAVVLCCLVFVLLWPRITQPALETYGDGSAFLTAELIAHDINSLSIADGGRLERSFPLEWNIEISKNGAVHYVTVSYKEFSSRKKGTVPVIANVDLGGDVSLTGVAGIAMEKAGGLVKVSALEAKE